MRDVLLGVLLLSTVVSCEAKRDVPTEPAPAARGLVSQNEPPDEPLLRKVVTVRIANGVPQSYQVERAPDLTYTFAATPKPDVHVAPPPQKLSQRLEQAVSDALARGAGNTRMEVIAIFNDESRLPRFPTLNESEPRNSATNLEILRKNESLIGAIRRDRSAKSIGRREAIETDSGAVVKEVFWLIDAMIVDLPLASIAALAARPDVKFVEHRTGISRPQHVDFMVHARAIHVSDPYFSGFGSGGFIGLLDSGTRADHVLLSNVDIRRDCLNGTSNFCTSGGMLNPSDECPFNGHGTPSASIITGNTSLMADSRGHTAIVVDSWKTGPGCLTDLAATIRGYEAAIPSGDRVIVDNNGSGTGDADSWAVAADAAFDAGAVVVAPVGNNGTLGAGTVRSPARALRDPLIS